MAKGVLLPWSVTRFTWLLTIRRCGKPVQTMLNGEVAPLDFELTPCPVPFADEATPKSGPNRVQTMLNGEVAPLDFELTTCPVPQSGNMP